VEKNEVAKSVPHFLNRALFLPPVRDMAVVVHSIKAFRCASICGGLAVFHLSAPQAMPVLRI
jgi:hypothetical protein